MKKSDMIGAVTISSDKRLLDPAAVAELYRELGWGTRKQYSTERMKKSIANCDIVIFALNEAGELVGLLRALTDHVIDTKALDLVIAPEYQRQGIGQKIMKKLAAEAKGTTIYFETGKKNFGFAAKCGYVRRKGLAVFRSGRSLRRG